MEESRMDEKSGVFIEGREVKFKDLGAPVLYMPPHAIDEDHPDCEVGFISTVRDGGIWARFHEGDTGAKCEPSNLRWL
jgi:hypothetical protein